MPSDEHANPLLLRALQCALARATGRRYQIDLARLDNQSLREFHRLLRDLDSEKLSAEKRARLSWWRRG